MSAQDAVPGMASAKKLEPQRGGPNESSLKNEFGTGQVGLAVFFRVVRIAFPPMRYLIELRLNHAMKLLRHTDDSIEKIAEECGFPNRYYFTRMLSRYRRTTPAAFRALMSEP